MPNICEIYDTYLNSSEDLEEILVMKLICMEILKRWGQEDELSGTK